MNRIKFEEHVLLYGGELTRWPDVLRGEAVAALTQNPAWQEVLDEACAFETMAMMRPVLPNDESFAERILMMTPARQDKEPWYTGIKQSVMEIMSYLPFPKPAYALVALATFGFGLGMVSQQESFAMSDSGSVLYEMRGIL